MTRLPRPQARRRPPPSAAPGMAGFTLIELMIVVAIVAILAVVVYPSYTAQVRKARRAEAQQVLMDIASRQQQLLLDTRAYASTLADTRATVPPTVTAFYRIEVTLPAAATAPAFTATATPLGDQAADTCGVMTINQTNQRLPANCW